MDSLVFAFLIPAAAVILDSFFGDPKSWPHPVRYIGLGLDLFEASARRVKINLRVAGWVAVCLFAVGSWSVAEILMAIPYLGYVVALYLAYAGLALGCLVRDARRVASLLNTGDIEAARSALAMLVSRDTAHLDSNQVRSTLAETVSENFNDGFVAPLFYLVVFGPGGLWAFKAVSTMDSMWGYRTAQYRDLGYAAAKTDDMLGYIPARISAWLLIWVGKGLGLDYINAKAHCGRDANTMESPNAGWSMAAAAWLLQGQMGGRNVYFGTIKEKPRLGPAGRVWDKNKLQSLLTLCQKTGSRAAWLMIPVLGWLQLFF